MLARHTGIPYKEFDIQDIEIQEDEKIVEGGSTGEKKPPNYIRTIQVGQRSNQRLVLVHGYGGSGIMFWKVIKPLAERYHLILIDILGMGGSSRPKLQINGHEEGEKFLVEWLEKWRVAMG